MKRKIKVFVADYDGTLIPNKPHELTPYCIKMINKLHDEGVLIGMASGKDYKQAKEIVESTNAHFDFLIGLNGAEYYEFENDKHVTLYGLKKDTKKYIITKMLEKFPNSNPAEYLPNGTDRLTLKEFTKVLGHHNPNARNVLVKDVSEFWGFDGGKIMFRGEEEETEKAFEYSKTLDSKDFYAIRTETTMLEFNHKDATKGNCLKEYCKIHNVDLEDVIAFGDMDNDKSMLLVAGTSVAVKNASQDIKDVCDIVLDKTCDEDGVAHFIEDEILE